MAPEESEPLKAAPVYSQLGWQWQWYGLTVAHLVLVCGPSLVLYPLIWLVCPSLSTVYAVWPTVCLAAFVGMAQFNQPPDALWTQLRLALADKRPNHLSPFLAETQALADRHTKRSPP